MFILFERAVYFLRCFYYYFLDLYEFNEMLQIDINNRSLIPVGFGAPTEVC